MNNTTKMKVSFTVRVNSEITLNAEELEAVKQDKAEGREILLVEELRQDIADNFDIDISCVEVLDHSEILVEGIGE